MLIVIIWQEKDIQLKITLFFLEYGDLRLVEGDDRYSGALEFNTGDGDWIPICESGFNDDAGDVACKQLGFKESDDLTTYDVIR